ncbi:MAG: PstS family phosphate ABC transporter substrate-binding protein [Cyanobacteria bacterium P01_D01_bin.105]
MSQSKNEIPALLFALGLTAAIVGGGGWWLLNTFRGDGPVESIAASGVDSPDGASSVPNGAPPNVNIANAPNADAEGTFSGISVPSGKFAYGGSTTWAPLRGEVDPMIEQAQPGFDLVYRNASGSSEGIQLLIDDELAFAQSSRPVTAAEKRQAQRKGVTLQEIPVALEAVAIATHPALPIPGLTIAQLRDIYIGRVNNWNQVGGPNLPIVPTSRSDSGTVQFFTEAVLEGQAFTPNTQKLLNTTAALRFVSETPGAIYFASAPEVVGQCTVAPLPIGNSVRELVPPYQNPYVSPEDCPGRRNQLNLDAFQSQAYPLIRPLYVVIRKDGQAGEQAGMAYANLLQTEEGTERLKETGFVPLP